jgi:hypothetical protein
MRNLRSAAVCHKVARGKKSLGNSQRDNQKDGGEIDEHQGSFANGVGSMFSRHVSLRAGG